MRQLLEVKNPTLIELSAKDRLFVYRDDRADSLLVYDFSFCGIKRSRYDVPIFDYAKLCAADRVPLLVGDKFVHSYSPSLTEICGKWISDVNLVGSMGRWIGVGAGKKLFGLGLGNTVLLKRFHSEIARVDKNTVFLQNGETYRYFGCGEWRRRKSPGISISWGGQWVRGQNLYFYDYVRRRARLRHIFANNEQVVAIGDNLVMVKERENDVYRIYG